MVRLADFFIGKEVITPPYILFRARSLVILHLFALAVSFCMMVATICFSFEQAIAPLFVSSIIIIINLFVFKRFQNFYITANLIVGLAFATFSLMAIDTGGLFSDNCIWITIIPMAALLFGGKKSGYVWLFISIIFNIFLYSYGIYAHDHVRNLNIDPLYYTISNVFLLLFTFWISFIFKSEQYYVVNSLIEQNKILEKKNTEIAEKSAKILEARQKLEQSNAELEQFAYVASHDLKEPLRMITLYTQMIKRKIKAHLDTETEEFMGFVVDGTKRMQQLLDDLLEYSRLGKKGTKNIIDLNDVMLVVQQNLKIPITNNGVILKADTLPKVNAVFSEMIQLFQNLVGNAIKFKKLDENPTIHVGIKSITNKSFIIQIQDNGIGMEAQGMEKIFNLFERLHTRDAYEGTGIGLATCKKVIENLGGKITVDSVYGKGSTFYLEFPAEVLSDN
jgi:signal transduction histidine kinase